MTLTQVAEKVRDMYDRMSEDYATDEDVYWVRLAVDKMAKNNGFTTQQVKEEMDRLDSEDWLEIEARSDCLGNYE